MSIPCHVWVLTSHIEPVVNFDLALNIHILVSQVVCDVVSYELLVLGYYLSWHDWQKYYYRYCC